MISSILELANERPSLTDCALDDKSEGTEIDCAALDAEDKLAFKLFKPLTVPSTAFCSAAVSTAIVLTASSSSAPGVERK